MRKEYKCNGGPYDGLKILLELRGTLEFKVGSYK